MMGEGLTELIDRLEDGQELRDADIPALSDMSRDEAAGVALRWQRIPLAGRAILLDRAAELADSNIDYNFEALNKIGLDDPEAEVRERAVAGLWECTDRRVGERLASLVTSDANAGVRAAAAYGLATFVEAFAMGHLDESAGEHLAKALRHALDDDDINVRAAALESAGGLPEPWVPERILEGYESEERPLRLAAIRAMGTSTLDRWTEYLEEQFYSDDPEFRVEAVIAAGQLGSELLLEPLAELLNDDDADVVLAVVMGIGEIGGDEAVELLQEYRPIAPEGIDEAVEGALEMARGGGFRRFGDIDEDDLGYIDDDHDDDDDDDEDDE